MARMNEYVEYHNQGRIDLRFYIIYIPKYSHVRPPPNEPIKEPITNKLAENKKFRLKFDNMLNISYI